MNDQRATFAWLPWIMAGLVFWVAVALALRFQDQLKEIVLVPLLYLFWVGKLALKSFDQRCLWLLALIITLALSLSFSRRKARPFEIKPTRRLRHAPAAGRIQFWRTQIRVTSSAVYAQNYRRSELRRLAIKALAYRQNQDDEQIKAQLRSGALQLPAEVSAILGFEDSQVDAYQPLNGYQRLKQNIGWFIAKFKRPTFAPDPQLNQVAEYLESLLEVDNDTRNR